MDGKKFGLTVTPRSGTQAPAVTLTTPWGATITATIRGSSAELAIPTNNIGGGRTWTVNVAGSTYSYVTGSNGDSLTSLNIAKGLALAINGSGSYTADGAQAFTRPHIRYNGQFGSTPRTVADVNGDSVSIPAGLLGQPVYLDANGNLTTVNTGVTTVWRGFQRTNSAGELLYLTAANSLTTIAGNNQPVIAITNQLLYLDANGNPTTAPTNNRQWISRDSQGTRVPLYLDADQNETTRIKNPSAVIDNGNGSGLALPLYFDEQGGKTTQPTPNKVFAATNDNAAPLVWYDSEALEVGTRDPLPIPRVNDNGTNAGTAIYDAPDNTRATLEIERLKLIVGTRPFEVYQPGLDGYHDTLIVDRSGSGAAVTVTLDHESITDLSTVAGLLSSGLLITGTEGILFRRQRLAGRHGSDRRSAEQPSRSSRCRGHLQFYPAVYRLSG